MKKALEPPDRGPLAFQGPSSLITGMVDAPKQLLKKEQQFSSEKTLVTSTKCLESSSHFLLDSP